MNTCANGPLEPEQLGGSLILTETVPIELFATGFGLPPQLRKMMAAAKSEAPKISAVACFLDSIMNFACIFPPGLGTRGVKHSDSLQLPQEMVLFAEFSEDNGVLVVLNFTLSSCDLKKKGPAISPALPRPISVVLQTQNSFCITKSGRVFESRLGSKELQATCNSVLRRRHA